MYLAFCGNPCVKRPLSGRRAVAGANAACCTFKPRSGLTCVLWGSCSSGWRHFLILTVELETKGSFSWQQLWSGQQPPPTEPTTRTEQTPFLIAINDVELVWLFSFLVGTSTYAAELLLGRGGYG